MLTVSEAPHNSFLSFDLWDRNSPTSFSFLWGCLPIIYLSVLRTMPHLFPSLLGIAQVVTPCQLCFWVPLLSASRWKARRRLKGRRKRKRKPLTSPPLPCSRHLLLRGYISLWLACVAPDPSTDLCVPMSLGGPAPLSSPPTLRFVAASHSGSFWGSLASGCTS